MNAKRRSKSATVHVDGKDKFPIDDQHSAKSAVKLINNAKPKLTSSQRQAVLSKAAKYGATPKTPTGK